MGMSECTHVCVCVCVCIKLSGPVRNRNFKSRKLS